MHLLMILIVVMGILACNVSENKGEDKFAIRKKTKVYYHARYLFSHADYEDVAVALRIEITAGSPAKMEIKDLTPPADKDVEELTLSPAGDDFTGTSSGADGGKYVVKLAADDVCCGAINFTPTADNSVTFVGAKQESLTSVQWEEIIEGQDSTEEQTDTEEQASTGGQVSAGGDTGQVTLAPTDLGTKAVGELFHIGASGADADQIVFKTYNDSGTEVTKALANWREAGNVYSDMRYDASNKHFKSLFFTNKAEENKVSKLVAFIDDKNVGELTVKINSASEPADLYAFRIYGGNRRMYFSFSATERDMYDIDISDKNKIKSFKVMILDKWKGDIHQTVLALGQLVSSSGYGGQAADTYTYSVQLLLDGNFVECHSPSIVLLVGMVGSKGESGVYEYNCPSDSGWDG